MKILLKRHGVPAATLLGLLAIAIVVGPVGPVAAATLATPAAIGTAGLGFWEALACVGCIAGFVVGAGTTLAGFAAFLAANPEIAILCVSSCTIAAT